MHVLKSRKFWASVIGLLSALGIYAGGNLPDETLVNSILIIVGVFVGSTAVEDGLSNRNVILPEVASLEWTEDNE